MIPTNLNQGNQKLKGSESNSTHGNAPLISVIICTYNREKYLGKCLDAFRNQTAKNQEYELVIINNNSPGITPEICQNFLNDNPTINAYYFVETNQGLAHARNKGIKESRGEYLSFIDDDAFVKPNFIAAIKSYFKQNPETSVVGGKILPIYESGKEPAWMTPYLETLMAAQNLGDEVVEFGSRKFPIGANMVFQKEAFNRVGMFNPELGRKGNSLEGGEEKDIIFKIRQQKGRVFYSPEIIVDHIIGENREEMSYIQKMGKGLGKSEMLSLIHI